MQSPRRYRWNPYNDVNVRTTETLKSLQFPISDPELDSSTWLIEHCPPEILPKDPVQVFIGQLFSKDSRRVMALVAQIAGVRMYAVVPIPRRCMFTTVVVAASDAPKLLQLNKKLRCELSSTGERVVRLLQGEDSELCEMTEAICPEPVGCVDHNTRRSTGIPQGPIVIERSQQGSSTCSRSRSRSSSSSHEGTVGVANGASRSSSCCSPLGIH